MAPLPSDDAVRHALRQRGAAEHLVRGGAPGLIARWRRFVAEVEAGYPFGLEDYRNDLDIRTLIGLAGLDSAVEAEDAHFREKLTDTGRAIWSSDVPGAFWVLGYPANASGDLLSGLRAEGLF
jgi:hypothetical protein